MKTLTQKNIKITFLVVLLKSLFVLIDNEFTKPIVVFGGENVAYKIIETILKEYQYCEKVMKKYSNKNLVMSEEEKKRFQSSNTCWIYEKRIDDDDEKVR